MTALFVSHGAPTIAIEDDAYTRTLREYGRTLAGAHAIAVVSAHWEAPPPLRVNAVARPEPIYDFGGFPRQLYTMRYDAPGDPELARDIAALAGGALETARGWDHGLWVPLHVMLRDNAIPAVEISLPHGAAPRELLALGRALGALRDDGVIVAGSGGIVHNLRALDFGGKDAPPAAWAAEFDAWVWEKIEARNFDGLAEYRTKAPHAELAAPTPEHFDPVFVPLGAARDDDELVNVFAGFHYATLSMRTFAFSKINRMVM
ncbi:MAG TPA: class III extradiol ring-cleavage dioxygenase [Thermoanaerobaculia bacterium]|nr:class III extradiol ring-cleavage dioxygenase [Thermoanaerobaculia bacterium]